MRKLIALFVLVLLFSSVAAFADGDFDEFERKEELQRSMTEQVRENVKANTGIEIAAPAPA